MKAAIHLGQNYVANLEVYRNTNFEELQNLFGITQRLISEHEAEILNVTAIHWTSISWTRSTLSHDQVITWTKAKVRTPSTGPIYPEHRTKDYDSGRQGPMP